MVNKVFKHQIRKNMEAYVDDILVKRMTSEHLRDPKKVFFMSLIVVR